MDSSQTLDDVDNGTGEDSPVFFNVDGFSAIIIYCMIYLWMVHLFPELVSYFLHSRETARIPAAQNRSTHDSSTQDDDTTDSDEMKVSIDEGKSSYGGGDALSMLRIGSIFSREETSDSDYDDALGVGTNNEEFDINPQMPCAGSIHEDSTLWENDKDEARDDGMDLLTTLMTKFIKDYSEENGKTDKNSSSRVPPVSLNPIKSEDSGDIPSLFMENKVEIESEESLMHVNIEKTDDNPILFSFDSIKTEPEEALSDVKPETNLNSIKTEDSGDIPILLMDHEVKIESEESLVDVNTVNTDEIPILLSFDSIKIEPEEDLTGVKPEPNSNSIKIEDSGDIPILFMENKVKIESEESLMNVNIENTDEIPILLSFDFINIEPEDALTDVKPEPNLNPIKIEDSGDIPILFMDMKVKIESEESLVDIDIENNCDTPILFSFDSINIEPEEALTDVKHEASSNIPNRLIKKEDEEVLSNEKIEDSKDFCWTSHIPAISFKNSVKLEDKEALTGIKLEEHQNSLPKKSIQVEVKKDTLSTGEEAKVKSMESLTPLDTKCRAEESSSLVEDILNAGFIVKEDRPSSFIKDENDLLCDDSDDTIILDDSFDDDSE